MMGLNHFRNTAALTGYAQSKNVPSPKIAVLISGLLLLGGSLGILLGIYVDVAVLLLALFLIPVSLMMHRFWTVSDPNVKLIEMQMFLKNMALLGADLMFLVIPEPWLYSIF